MLGGVEHLGIALASVGDETEFDALADAEGKAGEGRDLPPGERVLVTRTVFALHRPEGAGLRPRDEIDALIAVRQIEGDPHRLRHLREKPHVRELCAVSGIEDQIVFCEKLENSTLFLRGRFPGQFFEL